MAPDARRYAQAIVDALELPSALLGPAGELWVANTAWLADDGPPLAGRARGEVGDSYRTSLDDLEPTLRHAGAQLGRAIDAALDGSAPHPRTLTYRVRTSEQKIQWWRTEVRPADIEPRCLVLSHRDVTSQRKTEEELRRSQARLRTIVTGAPIVLFALNDEGQFTLVEGMGAVGAAFASPELVGQSVFDAYAQMPDLLDIVREALSGRVAVSTIEVGTLAYEVRCSPYSSRDGSRGGVVGVATDVTERLKAQRMKDEFVSIVSHELRTPLTSIRGSLGLLEGGVAGELPQKARELTRIARTNTDRLIRLINDILDLEKMESGRLGLKRKTVSMGEVAHDVAREIGALATQAGVTLDVQSVAPDTVHIDRDRIHQVITNLVSNAIKFSPESGVVTIDIEPANGSRIRVRVRDQGPGIAARDLPRLFKKFSQLDSSTRRTKMGSGLGLVILKSIVDAHGGRIWVESEVGHGSTFCFEVPRPVSEARPRASFRPQSTPSGQRRETMAMDSGLFAEDTLASPTDRIAALRRLLAEDNSVPVQAALDDAHANLNILAAVLIGESSRGLALKLRTEVEDALRAIAAGGTVDRAGLRLRLRELAQAFDEVP